MTFKDYYLFEEGKNDYKLYHDSYTSAVQTAIEQVEKKGFKIDDDDWWHQVAIGPKKPSAGKTNRITVKLTKKGKESKKALHMQIYGMEQGKYELNMYIS